MTAVNDLWRGSLTAATKTKLLAMSIMVVLALGVVATFSAATGYHGTTGSTSSLASSQAHPDNIRMPY